MRKHGLPNSLGHGFTQARAEAAADHNRLQVDQVDGRGGAGAEGLDRALDQPLGELVALFDRVRPHSTRQSVAAVLLHELEQAGLGTALHCASGPQLHRIATGIGLEAAAAPARAPSSADLHDGVADFARGASTEPTLLVDHDRTAHPGPPPKAEKGSVATTCAQRGLGLDRDAEVDAALWHSSYIALQVLPRALVRCRCATSPGAAGFRRWFLSRGSSRPNTDSSPRGTAGSSSTHARRAGFTGRDALLSANSRV